MRFFMKQMRILSNDYNSNLGNASISTGGPAHFVDFFSKMASERGHDWVGLVPRRTDSTTLGVSFVKKNKKVRFYEMSVPSKKIKLILRARHVKNVDILDNDIVRLGEYLLKLQPDVILLNGFSIYNWLILKAAHAVSIPTLVLHVGSFTREIEIYADQFSKAGKAILLEMDKDSSRLSNKEAFLTQWGWRQYNKQTVFVSKKNAVHLPLPYNSIYAKQSNDRSKALKKVKSIGVVARWDRIKNHQMVMALAEHAAAAGLPWKFYTVITIPESNKQRAFKHTYKRNVTVVPPMSPAKLRQFYTSMDIMILPSLFDFSPSVVMEAALSGTMTAISPNVGWVDYYRQHGAHQWILPYKDVKRTVRQLHALIDQPVPVELKKVFLMDHQPARVYKQFEKICLDLVACKGN